MFIKNIMKIQAKIDAWNREFEEFMILIKRYQKTSEDYLYTYLQNKAP